MTLHPTSPRREKLLVYGRPNSGKSSTWVSIADWTAKTSSTSRIHLATTDRAWDAMRYPEIEDVVTATELDLSDFEPWFEWAKKTAANVGRDDWIVVDKANHAWEGAQEYFWHRKTGGNLLADVFYEHQQAVETKGQRGSFMGGAHGANWDLIKRYYNAFISPLVNAPCHLLFCTDAKELREDMEGYAILKEQWKVGWMPAGEKNLPGFFHTWLFTAETPRGWLYTTVRDKTGLGQPKRDLLRGATVETGLVMDYLLPVCGWEL